jgi:hypothetical protein
MECVFWPVLSMNVQEIGTNQSNNARAGIVLFAGTLHPPFSRVLLNCRRSAMQIVGIFFAIPSAQSDMQ